MAEAAPSERIRRNSSMPWADDFDIIRMNLMKVRRVCFREVGYTADKCWCINGAADGGNVPCLEARPPTKMDLAGKEKV